jgi:hypothetical protein
VHAVRPIGQMRGRTGSLLVAADDGSHYVVKFRENPDGPRVLVNEWITARLLQHLRISCASPAVVEFTPDFCRNFPVVLHTRCGPVRPAPGVHFGSRYAGILNDTAVYDFVPDTLLSRVVNVEDFGRVLPFDLWAGQADARQCVFVRVRVLDNHPAVAASNRTSGFLAIMIDHASVFSGPRWRFMDKAGCGTYFRPQIYTSVTSQVLETAIDDIGRIGRSVIDRAVAEMPVAWIEHDRSALDALIERLMRRQNRVRNLTYAAIAHMRNETPWPNAAMRPGQEHMFWPVQR